MPASRTQLTLVGIGLALTAAAGPSAQKSKPPALPDIPGQAVLRCSGPATEFTDGVCGDGSSLYVDHSLVGGDPGVLVSLRGDDNQLRLRFDPPGTPARSLTAFIPERLLPLQSFECTVNCLAADDGNPISNTTVIVEVRDGQDARIQTTMRDERGRTVSGGPATLGVGESAPIDVLIGFEDPNGNGYRWGLYWSPVNYPGSDPATVTRTAACTWDVEALASDVVGLRLFNTGTGKNSTRSEGRFNMPFKLTFTANSASMPGGCGS
jgi:hypothetical protein